MEKTNINKILEGTVVSTKMNKTVVVSVDRFVKHPKYHKFRKISKRYKAHSESGLLKEGDKVSIKSVRPISKDKHFIVIE